MSSRTEKKIKFRYERTWLGLHGYAPNIAIACIETPPNMAHRRPEFCLPSARRFTVPEKTLGQSYTMVLTWRYP